MKKFVIVIIYLLFARSGSAQIEHPVRWSYAIKKIGKNEAVVFLRAAIDQGWHIYSTEQKEGGPVKTSFAFTPSKDYNLLGIISEPMPTIKYEKVFEMDVSYFENNVIFQQKVRLNTSATEIKGVLRFMVCNDKQCLPPQKVDYAIPIK